MNTFRDHVLKAVEIKGSQAKLAAAMGCSQQQVSYLINYAHSISAEMAVAIDMATKGAIPRRVLRPDIYGPAPKRPRKEVRASL